MTSPTQTRPSAPDTTADPFPWFPILALGLAGFLGLTVELSPAGLLNAIASDLDASIATVGTLTTFFALGNALLVLPLTSLAMRVGRRTALVAVMAVFLVSNLIVAAAPTIVTADVGRFISGASFAVQCSLIPAVAVRIAGPRHAVRAMSIVLGANTLGITLGAPLASIVGAAFGWRTTFVVAAALALLVALMMLRTVPQIHSVAGPKVSLLQAARLPGVVRVCLAWALLMLGHFVVLTYIDAYLEDLGISAYVTSLSLFVLGAGGILGIIGIGRISARSKHAALVVAPLAVALALGLLATGTDALPIVLAAVLVWGIGFSGTILIAQQTILLLGRRAPETAMSIGILLAQLGFALGATIGGLTVSHLSVARVPLVAVVFVIGAIVLSASLRSTVRRAESDEREEALA